MKSGEVEFDVLMKFLRCLLHILFSLLSFYWCLVGIAGMLGISGLSGNPDSHFLFIFFSIHMMKLHFLRPLPIVQA